MLVLVEDINFVGRDIKLDSHQRGSILHLRDQIVVVVQSLPKPPECLEQVGAGHLNLARGEPCLSPASRLDQPQILRGDDKGNGVADVNKLPICTNSGIEDRHGKSLCRGRVLSDDLRRVDIIVVIYVGAVIARRIRPARTDVIAVGITEDFDQPAVEIRFSIRHRFLEISNAIGLASQQLSGIIGIVEHGDGVVHRCNSALINLLEVGFPLGNLSGIDIERNHVLRQSQRIQA